MKQEAMGGSNLLAEPVHVQRIMKLLEENRAICCLQKWNLCTLTSDCSGKGRIHTKRDFPPITFDKKRQVQQNQSKNLQLLL